MTDKEKLDAAIKKASHEGHRINLLIHPDDKWILDELKKAAQAHADSMNESTKKATWIGANVQRGFIAFGNELYSPEFYEIKEKPPATEKDEK